MYGAGDCRESGFCGAANGRGTCVYGRCQCNAGYLNSNCSARATCTFWDTDTQTYSTRGLTAVAGPAGSGNEYLYCAATHLTDFGIISVPTSAAELLDEIVSIPFNFVSLDDIASMLTDFDIGANLAIFLVVVLLGMGDCFSISILGVYRERRRRLLRQRENRPYATEAKAIELKKLQTRLMEHISKPTSSNEGRSTKKIKMVAKTGIAFKRIAFKRQASRLRQASRQGQSPSSPGSERPRRRSLFCRAARVHPTDDEPTPEVGGSTPEVGATQLPPVESSGADLGLVKPHAATSPPKMLLSQAEEAKEAKEATEATEATVEGTEPSQSEKEAQATQLQAKVAGTTDVASPPPSPPPQATPPSPPPQATPPSPPRQAPPEAIRALTKQKSRAADRRIRRQSIDELQIARRAQKASLSQAAGGVMRETIAYKVGSFMCGMCKQLRDTCKDEHTIMGMIVPPQDEEALTPAQTIQIFWNVLILELVLICVNYEPPDGADDETRGGGRRSSGASSASDEAEEKVSFSFEAIPLIPTIITGLFAAIITAIVVMICSMIFTWGNSRTRRTRVPLRELLGGCGEWAPERRRAFWRLCGSLCGRPARTLVAVRERAAERRKDNRRKHMRHARELDPGATMAATGETIGGTAKPLSLDAGALGSEGGAKGVGATTPEGAAELVKPMAELVPAASESEHVRLGSEDLPLSRVADDEEPPPAPLTTVSPESEPPPSPPSSPPLTDDGPSSAAATVVACATTTIAITTTTTITTASVAGGGDGGDGGDGSGNGGVGGGGTSIDGDGLPSLERIGTPVISIRPRAPSLACGKPQ